MRAYIDADVLIWHLRGKEQARDLLIRLRDHGAYQLWTGALQRAEIVFFMRPDEQEATELFLSQFKTEPVDQKLVYRIARQQCCGPLQLTVGDVAVAAQSHFALTGIATAIGEQPIKMLISPSAGARMAVGEAWTNLVWAKIHDPEQVKCSANWMWAPKLAGEGAALNDAARAMRDAMIATGMAVDGGKDSLSM